MNSVLVNVFMLTYNQERFIQKAVESVLNQKTNFDFNIIIGEDCSSDKTREIIKNLSAKYGNKIVPLYNKENLGVIKNGINTFKACDAKYVATLAGDDYWTDENKLQKQIDFLEANPGYSFVFSNGEIVNDKDEITKPDRVPDVYKRNLSQRDLLSYCPPGDSVVMRNDLLQQYLALVPDSLNVDYFLYAMMASNGDAGYLDIKASAYRIHDNNVWASKSGDFAKLNYIKVCRSLMNYVAEENKNLLEENIIKTYSELHELNTAETYTDGALWTPQTAMLRSIRDLVLQIDGYPLKALSIDNNPTVEQMLVRKWPEIEIVKASYPQYDAQNLHQFEDESFDLVFSHQVLEHIPKPWLAASEMNRVLKSGGIGIHSSCAYNPRHGYPEFKDYYRFLPDGLAELFDGVTIWLKEGWGSKQALIYNLTVDDGYGDLGGRRFAEALAKKNDENYPWHTWVIFQKN